MDCGPRFRTCQFLFRSRGDGTASFAKIKCKRCQCKEASCGPKAGHQCTGHGVSCCFDRSSQASCSQTKFARESRSQRWCNSCRRAAWWRKANALCRSSISFGQSCQEPVNVFGGHPKSCAVDRPPSENQSSRRSTPGFPCASRDAYDTLGSCWSRPDRRWSGLSLSSAEQCDHSTGRSSDISCRSSGRSFFDWRKWNVINFHKRKSATRANAIRACEWDINVLPFNDAASPPSDVSREASSTKRDRAFISVPSCISGTDGWLQGCERGRASHVASRSCGGRCGRRKSLQTHQNRAWAKERQATPSSQRPGAVLWHGGQKLKSWCGTGTQLYKAGHTTYSMKAGIQVTKHEALDHQD